jgi:hypothetical protein
VLIKAYRGADFAMGYHNMNVVLGNHVLRLLALNGSFVQERKKGQIMLYKAWHDNGFVPLYVNKSTNLILDEVIDYELEGMQIEGLGKETSVHVNVRPGQEQFIKLVNTCGDGGVRKMSSKVRGMGIKTFTPKDDSDKEEDPNYL